MLTVQNSQVMPSFDVLFALMPPQSYVSSSGRRVNVSPPCVTPVEGSNLEFLKFQQDASFYVASHTFIATRKQEHAVRPIGPYLLNIMCQALGEEVFKIGTEVCCSCCKLRHI